MRGSLRELAVSRLGEIDYSFAAPKLFREELAADLAQDSGFLNFAADVAPVLLLSGSVRHADSGRRASEVDLHGVDMRFLQFFPEFQGMASRLDEDAGPFPSVIINSALRDELGVEIGDPLLISFGRRPAVNPEFVLGSRKSPDLLGTVRASVVEIVPDTSLGGFSIRPHQSVPYNVFVSLEVLQKSIDQPGMANTLFMSGAGPSRPNPETVFYQEFQGNLQISDLGLTWRSSEGQMILESRELIVSESLERQIRSAASKVGLQSQMVLTYLANTIRSEEMIPYSTVTAIDLRTALFREGLRLVNGEPIPEPGDSEIFLNEWAAKELNAREGDLITLSYYVVDRKEDLDTLESQFHLRGVLRMDGLAADQTLTPEIPGVQDAADIASWDPPVPIDLDLIRPEDEQYWDDYGSTPKAFLSYEQGAELWKSRFGKVTSVRFASSDTSQFESTLISLVAPEFPGYFVALKEQALDAAVGATDFGMLFIGFSLFLIVSAALLVALLFRLGVENRVREIGLLLSIGFRLRTVRRRFLLEGFLLAVVGALFGLLGAVGYAWLMIAGLHSLWVAAIGSTFLQLHVESASLMTGLLISVVTILGSIALVFRPLSRLPMTVLLAGAPATKTRGRSRLPGILLVGSIGIGGLLILVGLFGGAESSAGLFFGIGASFLVAGLSAFSLWLRKVHSKPVNSGGLLGSLQMAVRNSARNPGRSLLSTVLVGSACFVIVAVGANRSHASQNLAELDSGAGGFLLQARSDVPLVWNLNDPDARFELGFSDPDSDELAEATFVPFRVLPGEDVSCRNLYQPDKPRVLGVTGDQINRGGFQFQSLVREMENPWVLLEEDLGPGVIPAFGDANSVLWILHKALGEDILLRNEKGEEIRLRLVGLLRRSIFQSEILISEANFEEHFPGRSGYSFFLINTPPGQSERVAGLLEENLQRYGFDVTESSQVLESYLSVENTYLSTFQTLGGLGLLLGTLGLAIILIRNTIERTGELATLNAFGFSRRKLNALVLSENCFLLSLGITLGTLSALLAVAPHLLSAGSEVPWLSLGLTLVAVFAVGTGATAASVYALSRRPLLPALMQE